ncbi:MAG: hypothetical protein OHK0029_00520 [Armatimonadaceae bacterium]
MLGKSQIYDDTCEMVVAAFPVDSWNSGGRGYERATNDTRTGDDAFPSSEIDFRATKTHSA